MCLMPSPDLPCPLLGLPISLLALCPALFISDLEAHPRHRSCQLLCAPLGSNCRLPPSQLQTRFSYCLMVLCAARLRPPCWADHAFLFPRARGGCPLPLAWHRAHCSPSTTSASAFFRTAGGDPGAPFQPKHMLFPCYILAGMLPLHSLS